MEKSTAGKFRKWFIGLLIFIITAASVHAQLSYAAISSLRFHQKNSYVYSLTNEEFFVDIENVSPNDVSIYMNSIPDNVELVSIKKETYIPPLESTNSSYGTHIVITVRFLKSGNYKLFACDLQIKSNFFKIPFNPVHVFENIQMLKPVLSVSFGTNPSTSVNSKDITVAVGSHVQYTVSVQFASELQGISWTIPENSLFEQISEYEVPKISASERDYEVFSEFHPIATFDWIPLTEGLQKLPPISVVATAFNGSSRTLEFPSFNVHVLPAAKTSLVQQQSATADFAESYDASDEDSDFDTQKELSDNAIAEYCSLLKNERNSIPVFSNAHKKRLEFEKSYGISSVSNLPSRPMFYAFATLTALVLVLGILFFILRKYALFLFCIGLLCFFSGVTVFYGLRVKRQYAVVVNGVLMSIPEKDTSTGMSIQKGTLIRIKKYSGNWLYVKSLATYGWMQKENVIFIE